VSAERGQVERVCEAEAGELERGDLCGDDVAGVDRSAEDRVRVALAGHRSAGAGAPKPNAWRTPTFAAGPRDQCRPAALSLVYCDA
jgi:hypothetical protein